MIGLFGRSGCLSFVQLSGMNVSETELILIRFNLVNKNIKFSDNFVSDWSQMWLTFPVIILFSLNCF